MYKVSKVPGKNCYMVKKGSVIATKCSSLMMAKKLAEMMNKSDFRMTINKK